MHAHVTLERPPLLAGTLPSPVCGVCSLFTHLPPPPTGAPVQSLALDVPPEQSPRGPPCLPVPPSFQSLSGNMDTCTSPGLGAGKPQPMSQIRPLVSLIELYWNMTPHAGLHSVHGCRAHRAHGDEHVDYPGPDILAWPPPGLMSISALGPGGPADSSVHALHLHLSASFADSIHSFTS